MDLDVTWVVGMLHGVGTSSSALYMIVASGEVSVTVRHSVGELV